MGRTRRQRNRQKLPTDQSISLGGEDEGFKNLVQWMKRNGWTSMRHLVPVNFPSTGRGLKTLKPVPVGEVLATIPGKLLMTVETASRSKFGWIFKNKAFLTQQVLAAHLALERHLGDQSFWANYILSLPKMIMTPVFTSCAEINALPEDLSTKVIKFKENISELFEDLSESFRDSDKCSHCDTLIADVLTFDCFLWAWFIINSRAVYICPDRYSDHNIKLYDSNCLALAPYLDMFNHSNEAKVQAFINEVDGSYQIKTLAPFKKFAQVFIHYGDHSNLKLYMEYGFIISGNIHDTLPVTFHDVYSSVVEFNQQISSSKLLYSYLKSHDLLNNNYLSADGLSWSLKVLVYVLLYSEKVDLKTIQLKVYSNNFTYGETKDIHAIGKRLLGKKQAHIEECIRKMSKAKESKFSGNVSNSFLMAIGLYQEYLKVLNKCELSLNCD